MGGPAVIGSIKKTIVTRIIKVTTTIVEECSEGKQPTRNFSEV